MTFSIPKPVMFDTKIHSKCMGILQDCSNDASVFCTAESCNRAFCEECSEKIHRLDRFSLHTPFRKDAALAANSTCHLHPLSQCNAPVEVSCTACGDLRTCRQCFTNYHRKTAEHHIAANLLLKDVFTMPFNYTLESETTVLQQQPPQCAETQSNMPAATATPPHQSNEHQFDGTVHPTAEASRGSDTESNAYNTKCAMGCQKHTDCRQRNRLYHFEHDDIHSLDVQGQMFSVQDHHYGTLERECLNLSPSQSPQLEHAKLPASANVMPQTNPTPSVAPIIKPVADIAFSVRKHYDPSAPLKHNHAMLKRLTQQQGKPSEGDEEESHKRHRSDTH